MFMSQTRLEPAASIIAKFGGPEKVAEVTGKHISRVYRWMYEKARGGTGGTIPQAEAQKMLRYAEDNQIELSAADFFGSPVPEAANG